MIELLDVINNMNGNNSILWEGEDCTSLNNYLRNNKAGILYEPNGIYFEDVFMELIYKSTLYDERLIVIIDDLFKYPLKNENPNPLLSYNTSKIKIINKFYIGFDNIIWILKIHNVDHTTKFNPCTFLKSNESIQPSSTLLYKSNCILKFEEIPDNQIKVSLIKHPELGFNQWTLNKDFKEIINSEEEI